MSEFDPFPTSKRTVPRFVDDIPGVYMAYSTIADIDQFQIKKMRVGKAIMDGLALVGKGASDVAYVGGAGALFTGATMFGLPFLEEPEIYRKAATEFTTLGVEMALIGLASIAVGKFLSSTDKK